MRAATPSTPAARRRHHAAPPMPAVTEPMSAVDLAWLEMDCQNNPMVVAAILELEGVHSLHRLIDTLATRLEQHSRFRQCADDGCSPALWVGGQELDRAYHFHVRHLQGADPAATLRLAIAHELAAELERAHPLWRLVLFTGVRGKVTMLFRAHHAMADGVSLLRLLLKLADGMDAATPAAATPAPAPAQSRRGPLAATIHRLESLNAAWAGLQAFAQQARENPRESLATVGRIAGAAALMARVLMLRNRNPRRLRAALSGQRSVDWSARLPLAPLRQAAKRHGATLNDLLLSTLAGAFGRYLRETALVKPGQNLRISIPVDLRAAGDEAFGNCFGLLLFDLPIGEHDPHRRLKKVARRMARLKRSPEARAMLMVLAALGHLPVFVEKQVVGLAASKAAAVVSNLRGPDTALSFAGARLKTAVFWPPQTGSVGIGVSLLSYAGDVTLGLCCDTAVLAEPHRVIAAFDAELHELLRDD